MKCSNKGANPIRYRNRKEPATIDTAIVMVLGRTTSARNVSAKSAMVFYCEEIGHASTARIDGFRLRRARRTDADCRTRPRRISRNAGPGPDLAQAVKLWSLDVATCTDVLSHLVTDGYLCRRADGAFCRASDLTARRLAQG